jgi:hypothetical protein
MHLAIAQECTLNRDRDEQLDASFKTGGVPADRRMQQHHMVSRTVKTE